MTRPTKRQLRDLIASSITASGWSLFYLSGDNEHPFRFLVYKESESYTVKIYIWNVSHGGATRSAAEYRIQITGVSQFEEEPQPTTGSSRPRTLILGYWANNEVFAGFDIRRHLDPLGSSPSIQIGLQALVSASASGFGFHNRGNGEVAVAFRPDLFADYIQMWADLHDFGQDAADIPVVNQVVAETVGAEMGDLPDVTGVSAPRQTATRLVTEKVRDAGFRRRVIAAYEHSCAFCGVQLDLIDAAHIVPVGHPEGTDETRNGISLCALHHRAFDKSLVTFDEKWMIHLNNREVARLQSIGHDGGVGEFRDALREIIVLPADAKLRPRAEYVALANRHRNWNLS